VEKRLFDELVASLQEADIARGMRGRRTRLRLAERIREERQALQMIGPRAFKRRRPRPKHLRVRELSKRVVIRRKVIKR
jgi:hypothetical protein